MAAQLRSPYERQEHPTPPGPLSPGEWMEMLTSLAMGAMGGMKLPKGGGRPSLPPQPWERVLHDQFGVTTSRGLLSQPPPTQWYDLPSIFRDEPNLGYGWIKNDKDVLLNHDVLSLLQGILRGGKYPATFRKVSPTDPMHPTMRN